MLNRPAISALYAGGLNPSCLHAVGSARLQSGGVARVVAGVANGMGGLFHTICADLTRGFTASWESRFSGASSRWGLLAQVQNGTGYAADEGSYIKLDRFKNPQDWLGWGDGAKVSIPMRIDAGASSFGLHYGKYTGIGHVGTTADGPGLLTWPDFASGHWFRMTFVYVPPTTFSGTNGSVTLTVDDLTTAGQWVLAYSNQVGFESRFFLPQTPGGTSDDIPGDRAYFGWTATSGDGTGTVEVRNWTWTTAGVAAPAVHATGRIVVPAGPEVRLAAGVFGSGTGGQLLRTLCQAFPVAGGATYDLPCDGLDEYGNALPAGYVIKAMLDSAPIELGYFGNAPADPESLDTCLGGVDIRGVCVSPDGATVVVADSASDTAMQGGILLLNPADGNIRTAESLAMSAGSRTGQAVCCDATYIYQMRTNWVYRPVGHPDGPLFIHVQRYRISDLTPIGFTGTVGTTNPDGTKLVAEPDGTTVLELFRAFVPVEDHDYRPWPALACSGSSLWICHAEGNEACHYDAATGLQVGTPIAKPCPGGVAVLANGNLAVAHGATTGDTAATLLSVYNPTTHALVRAMTEVTGLVNVVCLSAAGGKLAVADDGFGAKQVKVYAITGSTATTPAIATVGGAPTYGTDDGINYFWHLRAVGLDTAGNIYTIDQPIGAHQESRGCKASKWSSAGVFAWRKYGMAYANIGVGGMTGDPDIFVSTNLKRYRRNPTTGDIPYIGSAAYRGFAAWGSDPVNVFSTVEGGTSQASPRWVRIGSNDFMGMTTGNHGRLVIFKHLGNGVVKPAAVVCTAHPTSGLPYSWHDANDTGYPIDSELSVGSVAINPQMNPQLGPDGHVYGMNDRDVIKLTRTGLDAHGNPIFPDLSTVTATPIATPAGGQYTGLISIHLSIATNGLYLMGHEDAVAPWTASELYEGYGYTQGGCRVLVALTTGGAFRWRAQIPEPGLQVAAHARGCTIGGFMTARFYDFDYSGLLLRAIVPATLKDYLDFDGAVAAIAA